MSFQLVCSGCGATSSPSVGICPYCKTVMTSASAKESGGIEILLRHYNEGRLESALALGYELQKQKPELFDVPDAALLLAKIMIETEAPSSQTRAVLVRANAKNPGVSEINDYLEILEAKNYLRKGPDAGESMLRSLLRRSPQNLHAHFILGSHLFWMEEDRNQAIPHLETCVRLRPNFLRAWACLGALYRQNGNVQLAHAAFQKCLALESNPTMQEFFTKQL